MQLANLFAVLVGGALGSILRWLVGLKIPFDVQQFSWGTFAVNMAACLLMGTLYPRLNSDFGDCSCLPAYWAVSLPSVGW